MILGIAIGIAFSWVISLYFAVLEDIPWYTENNDGPRNTGSDR